MRTFTWICLITAFTLTTNALFAQEEEEKQPSKEELDSLHRVRELDLPTTQKKYQPKWRDRPDNMRHFDIDHMRVGFTYGMRFDDEQYNLDFSPFISYRPVFAFELGAGFVYQYTDFRETFPFEFSTNGVGMRTFLRLYPWPYFFIHSEYLLLSTDKVALVSLEREVYHNYVFGGGFNIPISKHAYFITSITANMIENDLYNNRRPFYTFGFGVRL